MSAIQYLSNENFESSPFFIKSSGTYILQENIIFDPPIEQTVFENTPFALGFFAAIIILADDVTIDLNSFSISASKRFTYQQRFYSHIETNGAPFLMGQGPGNFAGAKKILNNITIKNGHFGLSSHHAIHGNNNYQITLENLTFSDFEVAAIALNAYGNVEIRNCWIKKNNQDLPINALWSTALYLERFALSLPDINNHPQISELSDLLKKGLRELLLYNQFISEELKIFQNTERLADGCLYGILIHPPGTATDDFDQQVEKKCENVLIENCWIENLKSAPFEVVTISQKDGLKYLNDVAGSTIRVKNLEEIKLEEKNLENNLERNFIEKRNIIIEVQLLLARYAYQNDLHIGKMNIAEELMQNYYMNQQKLKDNLLTTLNIHANSTFKYVNGLDTMGHLMKGNMGIRLDACRNVLLRNIQFSDFSNLGPMSDLSYQGKYHFANSISKRPGYFGADLVGINLADVCDYQIKNIKMENFYSQNGLAVGISLIYACQEGKLEDILFKNFSVGYFQMDGIWYGIDGKGRIIKYEDYLFLPKVILVKLESGRRPIMERVYLEE